MKEQEYLHKTIKQFDEYELVWIKEKGYHIYNNKLIDQEQLVDCGYNKEKAIHAFDKLILEHLYQKYPAGY